MLSVTILVTVCVWNVYKHCSHCILLFLLFLMHFILLCGKQKFFSVFFFLFFKACSIKDTSAYGTILFEQCIFCSEGTILFEHCNFLLDSIWIVLFYLLFSGHNLIWTLQFFCSHGTLLFEHCDFIWFTLFNYFFMIPNCTVNEMYTLCDTALF